MAKEKLRSLIVSSPLCMIATCVVTIPPAGAQYPTDWRCNTNMKQLEQNECAYHEFKRADAELNAIYSKMMTMTSFEVEKTRLRQAQRAWVTFRDAECLFFAGNDANTSSGSIGPWYKYSCLYRLTHQRVYDLGVYLSCTDKGIPCYGDY